MKILSVAAEVAPFSSVGGLAQGINGLNTALHLHHDIKLFTPLYGSTISNLGPKITEQLTRENNLLIYNYPPFPIIFYDSPNYFSSRNDIYNYPDDHFRFYNFSVACADWLLLQFENHRWFPDLIHLHEWQTGYLSEIIKTFPKYNKISHLTVFFTIHNFKYQGPNNIQYLDNINQDKNQKKICYTNPNKLDKINPLLRGIIYSDKINTVSPNYAKECLTSEYGYNLSPYTNKYSYKISGILNGLDTSKFDPRKSPTKYPYDKKNFFSARSKNKRYIQKIFHLKLDKNAFLCAFVGRLLSQKGLELIPPAIDNLIKKGVNIQLIIQGNGNDYYYDIFYYLKLRHPQKISINYQHRIDIPQQIYSGCDALIIPSRFEPCGNVVFEALRFGCVPIVRNTGGMADTINQFDLHSKGNGFVFNNFDSESLTNAINFAHNTFQNKILWKKIQNNCFKFNRTWVTASLEYSQWFHSK